MMKRSVYILILIILSISVYIFNMPVASAYTSRENIIDDDIFSNESSMTEPMISSFINSFPSSCLLPQNQPIGLSAEAFKTPIDYSHYDTTSSSPAHIISWASTFYHLNPQVILTTLEKENNLVTGSMNCASWRYNSAMGYNCPDVLTLHTYANLGITDTCVEFEINAGFSRQVSHASWQLSFDKERAYGNLNWLNDWATPYTGRMTQGNRARCIRDTYKCTVPALYSTYYYDGLSPIDGQSIYISNGATAALYNYTPHFNSFNSIFTNWFGSPYVPPYAWKWAGQAVYSDSARTIAIDPSTVSPNTTYYVRINATNNGNTTWTNSGGNPLNLGTANPADRASQFCDSSWLSCNRPASLKEASVAYGQVGTFEFSIKTPATLGSYNEYFRPLVEGKQWMDDAGLYISLGVKPPTYAWKWAGQAVYSDSQKLTLLADTPKVSNQSTLYVVLKAINVGNAIWQKNIVKLGVPGDNTSPYCNASWISCNRAATITEATVSPGQTGTFEFPVTIPYGVNGTTQTVHFAPLAENITWMNDLGQYWAFNMDSPNYQWQYVGQGAYSDSGHTVTADTANLQTNKTYYLTLAAKNIGGQIWNKGQANLGTANAIDRNSVFCNSSWLVSCNRPATIKENSVAPGQIGNFEFSVVTPTAAGTYSEYFRPVAEGLTWMNDVGQYWSFVVR